MSELFDRPLEVIIEANSSPLNTEDLQRFLQAWLEHERASIRFGSRGDDLTRRYGHRESESDKTDLYRFIFASTKREIPKLTGHWKKRQMKKAYMSFQDRYATTWRGRPVCELKLLPQEQWFETPSQALLSMTEEESYAPEALIDFMLRMLVGYYDWRSLFHMDPEVVDQQQVIEQGMAIYRRMPIRVTKLRVKDEKQQKSYARALVGRANAIRQMRSMVEGVSKSCATWSKLTSRYRRAEASAMKHDMDMAALDPDLVAKFEQGVAELTAFAEEMQSKINALER